MLRPRSGLGVNGQRQKSQLKSISENDDGGGGERQASFSSGSLQSDNMAQHIGLENEEVMKLKLRDLQKSHVSTFELEFVFLQNCLKSCHKSCEWESLKL